MTSDAGAKELVLFFLPSQCSGCGICEMACSLENLGQCSSGESHIHVLRHPRLGTSVVAVDAGCEKCLQCVKSCNLEAIRFATERDWGRLLKEGWLASPVVDVAVRHPVATEAA